MGILGAKLPLHGDIDWHEDWIARRWQKIAAMRIEMETHRLRKILSKARRLIAGASGLVILALVTGRCSPLASSISKQPHFNQGVVKSPSDSGKIVSSYFGELSLIRCKTRVFYGEDEDKADFQIHKFSKLQSYRVLTLNDNQLEQLRSEGNIDLIFPESTHPDKGEILFDVNLSRKTIDETYVGDFQADLKQKEGRIWTLRVVTPLNDPEAQASIQYHLDHLKNVAIIFTHSSTPSESNEIPPKTEESKTSPKESPEDLLLSD